MIKSLQPSNGQFALVQNWEVTFPLAYVEVCKMLGVTPLDALSSQFRHVDDPIHVGSSIYIYVYSFENLMKRKPLDFDIDEIRQMVMEAYTIESLRKLATSGQEPLEAWKRKWQGIKGKKRR